MDANENSYCATGRLATLWASLPDVQEVHPVTENDNIIFDEIKEVLTRHGALHRFGLNLLHRHFQLRDGECILETTDSGHRRQIIEVKKMVDVAGDNVMETQWAFDGTGTLVCVGYCDYNKGHRRVHNAR